MIDISFIYSPPLHLLSRNIYHFQSPSLYPTCYRNSLRLPPSPQNVLVVVGKDMKVEWEDKEGLHTVLGNENGKLLQNPTETKSPCEEEILLKQ